MHSLYSKRLALIAVMYHKFFIHVVSFYTKLFKLQQFFLIYLVYT